METAAKSALIGFLTQWLASLGHGSADSLKPRVEAGVDLLIAAVREAAINESDAVMARIEGNEGPPDGFVPAAGSRQVFDLEGEVTRAPEPPLGGSVGSVKDDENPEFAI